jgi:hypothetical protein
MSQIHQSTGQFTDGHTLKLDDALPIIAGKVRVTVEQILDHPKSDLIAFERELRARQQARGHVPRTKEEIDAYLEAERNSWD